MFKKKVSIIVPCYNCEHLISETLESLVNQTYSNFEIICINDGSTDNTFGVLNSYEENYKGLIYVYSQKNSGVSGARNYGINVATGEYIMFCDSDDLYNKHMVESLVQAIEIDDSELAYCLLSRNKEKIVSSNTHTMPVKQVQEIAMSNLLFRMWDFGFYCYIYKKELIVNWGVSFYIDAKYGEDREFIWKYICHCRKIIYVESPMYWYRENPHSATKGKMTWRRTDSLQAVKRTEKYLKENACVFYSTYCSYMYARVMWAIAKAYAVDHNKKLFCKLMKEYNVKNCMKRTAKDKILLVRLASVLYLIHPMLFYYTVGLKR